MFTDSICPHAHYVFFNAKLIFCIFPSALPSLPQAIAMRACDPKGPLMIYVTKLFPKPDCNSFEAFGRVFSGTVRTGDTVKVLGEGYVPEDPEDMQRRDVTRLALAEAR